MKTPLFTDAVTELKVTELTTFLKDNPEFEIVGWKDKKAAEKRDAFLSALTQSLNMRREFVAFYSSLSSREDLSNDWQDWEADLAAEDIEDAETVEDPDAAGKAAVAEIEEVLGVTPEPKTVVSVHHGSFVEGGFEQMVADVAGMEEPDATANLRDAEQDIHHNYVKMGILLAHVQRKELFLAAGCENMREYIAKHTELKYRKAMYLVANANVVQELGITAQDLQGVSWAALRHVLSVIDKGNYKKWLDAARSLPHLKLMAAVDEEKAKQAGNALPKPSEGKASAAEVTLKKFNLYPDQLVSVNEAIEKAKIEANTDSTGAALDAMAAAYVGKPMSKSSAAAVLPDLTNEGLTRMLSKIKADEGNDGLQRVLIVIGDLWPDVLIEVDFDGAAVAAE